MNAAGGRPGKLLAVILGSGLGAVSAHWPVSREVPFREIPGLDGEHVAGHEGAVKSCSIGSRSILLIAGRKHRYEGSSGPIRILIGHIADLGATHLLLTSAAGSLDRSIPPGEIGIVRDLIDLQFRPVRAHPASTGNGGRSSGGSAGAAFTYERERPAAGMRGGLDRGFGGLVERAAAAAGVALCRGTMASMMGPAYETPAEVAMLRKAGAGFVTMSAAPEIAYAVERGVSTAALAIITNYATGISNNRLAHDEVLRAGTAAVGGVRAVIEQLVAIL